MAQWIIAFLGSSLEEPRSSCPGSAQIAMGRRSCRPSIGENEVGAVVDERALRLPIAQEDVARRCSGGSPRSEQLLPRLGMDAGGAGFVMKPLIRVPVAFSAKLRGPGAAAVCEAPLLDDRLAQGRHRCRAAVHPLHVQELDVLLRLGVGEVLNAV